MAPINTNNNAAVTDSHIAALALQTAQGQVGQSEKPIGSNSGPMVNEYLKSVGLNPGYAWCQAFVYWCYAAAAKKLNRANPVIKTGGVHDCWNRSSTTLATSAAPTTSAAPATPATHTTPTPAAIPAITKLLRADAILKPELITPGTQFILSFGGTTGHTGIVEKVDISSAQPNGAHTVIIHTIEGNSNNNGSREGFEVVRHQRNINDKDLLGFIKYC